MNLWGKTLLCCSFSIHNPFFECSSGTNIRRIVGLTNSVVFVYFESSDENDMDFYPEAIKTTGQCIILVGRLKVLKFFCVCVVFGSLSVRYTIFRL